MSKFLVGIELPGGMDGLNFMSARDATSVTQIQTQRQGAASNVLDYTEAFTVSGDTVSDSAVVSNIASTSAIVVGMLVYGDSIPAQRGLTVLSKTLNTITLSAASYVTATATILYCATATQLFKLNESNSEGRNPAFHYTQTFLRDAFNVLDTTPNLGKVKAAVVANIGPLRRPLLKNGTGGSIFNMRVPLDGGGTRGATLGQDFPLSLTSHNDQTSTWHSNAPEGAVVGWGGGIADSLIPSILGAKNKALASISSVGKPAFSAGAVASIFNISSSGLIRLIPGFDGRYTSDGANTSALNTLFLQAMVANKDANDYTQSIEPINTQSIDFQTILSSAMNITDIPTPITYNISGGNGGVSSAAFLANLKQVARLIHTANPNRGFTATRSGNTTTFETEISTGIVNRVGASTTCTVTCTDHRLFTSSASTSNLSDSVIILTSGATIDSSIPADGYKITLLPSDEDNKFTFTSTSSTALVDVPVTIRLKHNLTTNNVIYVDNAAIDSTLPDDGYPVISTPSNITFTITTIASGAYTGTTLNTKVKLININTQVIYSVTAGMSWDSHAHANHNQLAAMNHGLIYYNNLVSRIKNADVVTFTLTEFGRTSNTNGLGTDHAWGNTAFVFGKSVRGNKVYGTIPSLIPTGPDLLNNILLPTTAVYQYGATFAKWMGLSDAQILGLFPDLNNWVLAQRELAMLDPPII